MAERRRRLLTLRKTSKALAAKVFICGDIPALMYDVPIYGLFGSPLKALRRETGVAKGFLGKKRDPDLAYCFFPEVDPEIQVAMAVFSRFCKEVWNASLPTDIRDPAVLSLGSLARGISGMMATHGKSQPRKVEGPLSALFKLLKNYGWKFHTPFVLKDKQDNCIHLLQQCPRRVAALFKADVAATIERRAVVRLHMRYASPDTHAMMNTGMFFLPLKRLRARLSKSDAFTLMLIVCNGIFTNTDLVNFGYLVDPTCNVCYSALDTVYHRCYTCAGITGRAKVACGDPTFQAILDAGQDSMLGNRCLLAEPLMESVPSRDLLIEYVNMGPSDGFLKKDGKVYGDGSCLHPNCKPLCRAGFGLVQVDSNGDVIRGMYGSVPAPLPQSSLSGEYSAFCTAAACSEKGCTYVGDCQEVLDCYEARQNALLCDVSFACVWRLMSLRCPNFRENIVKVEKVKAHKCIESVVEEGGDLLDFHGNYHADLFARMGAELHSPSATDVLSLKRAMRRVQDTAEHMIDVLSVLKLQRKETRCRADTKQFACAGF